MHALTIMSHVFIHIVLNEVVMQKDIEILKVTGLGSNPNVY